MSFFISVSLSLQLLLLLFISSSTNAIDARRIIPDRVLAENSSSSPCPLNFTVLETLLQGSKLSKDVDVATECHYIQQGLRLVLSEYLRVTNHFLPPLNSSESCWNSYQKLVDAYIPSFDIRPSCGFETSWISQGCMNITTRSDFERIVPKSSLDDIISSCNQSLGNNSPCASCTTSCSNLQASYLNGDSIGNVSDCAAYPLIYAGGVANIYGPTDPGTDKCLFDLNLSSEGGSNRKMKSAISVIAVVVFVGLVSLLIVSYVLWRRRRKDREVKRRKMGQVGTGFGSSLESLGGSTHLIKFTFDDIREATKKFSRDYIIGKGGYGNVYKGILPDGSEVAVKRFKNCSALGEASFAHEVEVIASVRHVNLVALRGYCVATTPLEGHQRIIVCDLMKNGSLHDHLFGHFEEKKKLSWPVRQRVALGTARGLAYLHYGAQPSIIHRDIKASNILLDDDFEAKVADFGLAKFTPEGMTHLSTRVAGTMGYVAPEYALYGQLTERSDVYSFGVLLLELLSGKKAIISVAEGQPSLVTDWAWSSVKKGNALDVVEDGMLEMESPELMEKYVLVAVLCSHPQLYARPTMDQVVKILETDLPIPSIPERPIPLVANLDDIERSASSSGSGHLFTPTGYQSYAYESHDSNSDLKDSNSDLKEQA